MRLLRRGSARLALLAVGLCSVLLYVYYSKYYVPASTSPLTAAAAAAVVVDGSDGSASSNPTVLSPSRLAFQKLTVDMSWTRDESSVTAKCPVMKTTQVDIDTTAMYPTLNFSPRYKEFWNENFERRYLKRRENWKKLPLQVVIMPHSHNDPGWLKTFEGYFHSQTSSILNNMVDKLIRYPNMTFVWSEISFLAKWWKSAHHQRRQAVKELLASGRLELLAGGWVMTDEATVNLYSMIDQMIEGHQWIRHHLNVTPRFSWSIDPFGHGATMPYLLKSSGLEGTTVQRIHHGWKERMAELQSSDFVWRQQWDPRGRHDIFCHNFPFDIYNIKHSCGPHTQVCLTFDFRKIRGEFTEFTQRTQPITQWNVRERSETLLAQYGRTASLFPHNVALVLLGDDFRFDHALEWDQQIANYNLLFNYINSHTEYNAHVQFGTFSTYYDLIERRMSVNDLTKKSSMPILTGDFFVYSDVFNEGRPAYWSGYFTTRPYWKALARELESTLRSTEIVFTLALARARQQAGLNRTVQILEGDYERMTAARQRLADFQHHDAITGTSKAFVMHDFGVKLFDAIQLATSVLTHTTQYLLTSDPLQAENRYESLSQHWPGFLYPPYDRANFFTLPHQIPLSVQPNADVRLVLVNTLAHFRQELVKVVIRSENVQLLDPDGRPVSFQLNPVWNSTAGPFQPVRDEVELAFMSTQPPMSISVYVLQWLEGRSKDAVAVTSVHNVDPSSSSDYPNDLMAPVRRDDKPPKEIRLANTHLRAGFDPVTGFLETIQLIDKSHDVIKVNLSFQAYLSAQFHSGAYLFMPEPRQPVVNVSDVPPLYSIMRGPIFSEVTIVYPTFMRHVTRVYHDVDGNDGAMSRALFMENHVEYPPPPNFRETELFMRLTTNIDNGDVFYTDQNCFQMQKRVRLKNLGPEVNYYPLSCAAYIEDTRRRLTLLMSHAHGGSSLQNGLLEVMLERRTMYDDGRGLGEGVVDNKPTLSRFWLVPESRRHSVSEDAVVSRPTSLSQHLSNLFASPTSVFIVDDGHPTNNNLAPPDLFRRVFLIGRPFPCDVHVLNWRVLPVTSYFKFPSHSALLLLHRQGYSCDYEAYAFRCPMTDGRLSDRHRPTEAIVASLQRTSLTALFLDNEVLDGFDRIAVPPMEISSFNVTFV